MASSSDAEQGPLFRGLAASDKLTRFNWFTWLRLVQPVLKARGVAAYVPDAFVGDDDVKVAADAAAKAPVGEKQALAMSILLDSATPGVRALAKGAKTANDTFRAYQAECMPTVKSAWQDHATALLESLMPTPREGVDSFVARLGDAFDIYAASFGNAAPNERKAKALLRGLRRMGDSWARWADTVELLELQPEVLRQRAIAHEMSLVSAAMTAAPPGGAQAQAATVPTAAAAAASSDDEDASDSGASDASDDDDSAQRRARHKGRQRGRGRRGGGGRQRSTSRTRGGGRERRTCFECGERGHLAADCPTARGKGNGNGRRDSPHRSGGRSRGSGWFVAALSKPIAPAAPGSSTAHWNVFALLFGLFLLAAHAINEAFALVFWFVPNFFRVRPSRQWRPDVRGSATWRRHWARRSGVGARRVYFAALVRANTARFAPTASVSSVVPEATPVAANAAPTAPSASRARRFGSVVVSWFAALLSRLRSATGRQAADSGSALRADSERQPLMWCLDSGATFHMTTCREALRNVKPLEPPLLTTLADGRIIRCVERGDVLLMTARGEMTLLNVVHMPTEPAEGVHVNLASVSRFTQSGGTVQFTATTATGRRARHVVFEADRSEERDWYLLRAETAYPAPAAAAAAAGKPNTERQQKKVRFADVVEMFGANAKRSRRAKAGGAAQATTKPMKLEDGAASENAKRSAFGPAELKLWHQRLAHVNEGALRHMHDNGIVDGLKGRRHVVHCDICKRAKLTRHRFGAELSQERATECFERVHADVVGPFRTAGTGGERYLLIIVDEFSDMVFAYKLKAKSEVAGRFKQWHALVRNQYDARVREVHSDHGGEFISDELLQYWASFGVVASTTSRDTPQHNGKAERKNRTFVEAMRSLLLQAALEPRFWPWAADAVEHLLNRTVRSTRRTKTPYEVVTGRKPSLRHLRVFGCDADVHLKGGAGGKLGAKSRRMIFVGYEALRMAYRFWDASCNRLVVERDAAFDENAFTVGRKAGRVPDGGAAAEASIVEPLVVDDADFALPVPVDAPLQTPRVVAADVDRSPPTVPAAPTPSDSRPLRGHEAAMDAANHDGGAQEEVDDEESAPVAPAAVEPGVRRSTRERRQVDHGPMISRLAARTAVARESAFAAKLPADVEEPKSYEEAMDSPQRKHWKRAMDEEMASQREHKTWTEVPRSSVPRGKRILPSRWVFKAKRDASGAIARYKARTVVKGFAQRPGSDFEETFAPVMAQRSLRALLSLAAARDLELRQADVVTAFLHAPVEEELYMELPPGYSKPGMVAHLNKAVYGLRQGPRAWNKALDKALRSLEFRPSRVDPCIYVRGTLILGIFVDDIVAVFAKQHESEWRSVFAALDRQFKLKDLGEAQHVLGWRVSRDRKKRMLFIDQAAYIRRVAKRFGADRLRSPAIPMSKRPAAARDDEEATKRPYAELIGSLQYAATCTRPDVSFSVGALAQYTQKPTDAHWTAAMRVLRYLNGTADKRLVFGGGDSLSPCVFSDASWGGDGDDEKSVSGFLAMIGDGAPVTWTSRKQREVALSSMESELIAAVQGVQDAKWLRNLLEELGVIGDDTTVPLFVDNEALLPYIKNGATSTRTRHVNRRYHFVRDNVERGEVELVWVQSESQLADLLTKPLDARLFCRLRDRMLA
jgi:transposase InsO family protein